MVDATYTPLIYRKNGGNTLVVASGGIIELETGGDITINGVSLIDEVAALSGLDSGELGVLNAVTAGTVTASKAIVVDANKDIADFRNLSSTNLKAGKDAVAGTVEVWPSTTARGKAVWDVTNQTGNTTVTYRTAAMGQATVVTTPDPGAAAASVVLTEGAQTINGAKTFGSSPDVPQTGYKVDAVAMSSMKWVDVTVTAALLDSAGSVNVIAGVAGDQYKIRNVRLVGGGTNFGAGGDRLIDLTDGTTVWTTIANADIESAPSATLDWGNAKVPYLTGTSDTASASAAAIRFQYSGGTTDHGGTGSIKFSVQIEKVA